jgi:hypothetical protein
MRRLPVGRLAEGSAPPVPDALGPAPEPVRVSLLPALPVGAEPPPPEVREPEAPPEPYGTRVSLSYQMPVEIWQREEETYTGEVAKELLR